MPVLRHIAVCVFLAGACVLAAQPTAAEFPDRDRPVRLIVSSPPGGRVDVIARIVADGLAANSGATVVVDNQSAAAGTIAAANVARAAPDGYTMLVSMLSVFAILPHTRKMEFDPAAALTPVARISEAARVFAVHPRIRAATLLEFVAYAKQNPGLINYGSTGAGSALHILTESFRRAAGIQMQHVPYRGAGAALHDLLSGNIDVLMDAVVVPHIHSGKLRGLAVGGEKRLEILPDLPTLAEAGFPSVRASAWHGLFGPAMLPPDIAGYFAHHLSQLYADEAFRNRLIAAGVVSSYLGSAAFTKKVADDHAYFGKLVRDLDISSQN